MNKQKGFTIIELIVVIAIIAVLAAVVLVNVTAYLNKGRDAAIKGNMSGLMTNAAVYFDANGNYTNFCANSSVSAALTEAKRAYGDVGGNTADCNSNATEWAACSQLKSSDVYFCVDSTGVKKEISTRTTCVANWSATACP